MKQKIKVTGYDGSVTEGEIIIPNKDHLASQMKYKAQVYKPKKGKGSFKRHPKHK